MNEQGRQPLLPRVEQVDLAAILTEDIINPEHTERWKRLARDNPELAHELLKRAEYLSRETNGPLDVYKGSIDLVTYVVNALEVALTRIRGGDVDAGGQPL